MHAAGALCQVTADKGYGPALASQELVQELLLPAPREVGAQPRVGIGITGDGGVFVCVFDMPIQLI